MQSVGAAYGQVGIIVQQIGILCVLALIGYISGKTGYLPKETGGLISKIVVRITAPSLVLTSIIKYDFTAKSLIDGAWIMFSAAVFAAVSYLLAIAATKLMKMETAQTVIYRMHSIFGNFLFLGIPLIYSILGTQGVVYAMFYVVVMDALTWTWGVYKISQHHAKEKKINIKSFLNINTIVYVIGVFLVVSGLRDALNQAPVFSKVYETIILKTLSPLGATTIYLTMLFIGLFLAEIKIDSVKSLMMKYPSFILSVSRLLIIPLFALFTLLLCKGFISADARTIIVLELAMPGATVIAALAAEYGADYRFATENIFFSTLLSIVTLPFIYYIVTLFG